MGKCTTILELKNELKPYFKFHTHSDTEVVLNAFSHWGVDFLNRLNGMFALAIYDNTTDSLFIARDRFGVKPFYYSFSSDGFLFASEIKTLWAFGINKTKNQKVWANYYVYGSYGLPNETFWEDIHQLPAGHYAILHKENRTSWKPVKWYDFVSRINTVPHLEVSKLKEEYLHLINDAVQLRFRADVPIGMNVSGGLDSSTLIALIHKNLPKNVKMEAFTFYCDDVNYDELPWVENLLEGKPYSLNKVLLKPQEVPELIKMMSNAQDEPFGGFPTLAYSQLFKEARSKGIKVLLDGQGMDEAWAGYDYYHNQSTHLIQGSSHQSSTTRSVG